MNPRSYDPDIYKVYIPLPTGPVDGAVRALLREGLSRNWTASPDGRTNTCRYFGSVTNSEWQRVSIAEAIEDLEQNHSGSIKIFSEKTDFVLWMSTSYDRDDLPDSGGIGLSWDRVHFRDEPAETAEEVFETAAFVFDYFSAPFAFSRVPNDLDYETSVSQKHVTEAQIPDVFWLTLLSGELSNKIGRSRLETAPSWKTEPLNDGGFGLVVTENPGNYWREDKFRVKDYLGLAD